MVLNSIEEKKRSIVFDEFFSAKSFCQHLFRTLLMSANELKRLSWAWSSSSWWAKWVFRTLRTRPYRSLTKHPGTFTNNVKKWHFAKIWHYNRIKLSNRQTSQCSRHFFLWCQLWWSIWPTLTNKSSSNQNWVFMNNPQNYFS